MRRAVDATCWLELNGGCPLEPLSVAFCVLLRAGGSEEECSRKEHSKRQVSRILDILRSLSSHPLGQKNVSKVSPDHGKEN